MFFNYVGLGLAILAGLFAGGVHLLSGGPLDMEMGLVHWGLFMGLLAVLYDRNPTQGSIVSAYTHFLHHKTAPSRQGRIAIFFGPLLVNASLLLGFGYLFPTIDGDSLPSSRYFVGCAVAQGVILFLAVITAPWRRLENYGELEDKVWDPNLDAKIRNKWLED